ncbi:hypothetical protein [Prosthecobacter sp.]|uniref:hypothetical protein n=1 Tax=Prosthecobacter sp. TaxID=1965333 RepID=UPI003783A856
MSQVNATIGVKTAPFKRGLDEMRSNAQKWGGDLKQTIAGAFAFGAVSSFVSNFIGEMARIKDLADRLGESTDTIQRVGNAAKLSGVDLEYVTKVLTKLTTEAAKSADGFNAIGVSGAAFANAGMEDKILMLAKAYEECGGSQDKLLKLMSLLGPKGQDMMIMLAGGAEELKNLFNEVPTVNAKTINSMAKLDDTIDKLVQRSKAGFGDLIELTAHWAAKTLAAYQTLEPLFTGKQGKSFDDNYAEWMSKFGMLDEKPTGPNKKKDFADAAEEATAKAKAAADAEKAAKALDAEMLELARSRMDAEQKIASLKKEQAEYAAAANDKTTPEADRLEAAKKVLEIQQQIESRQAEGAKKSKELKDAIDKNKLDKMTPEERLAELKKQQAEMIAEAEKTPEKIESKQKKIDAIGMNGQIEAAQKEIDDKKKKEADDAERKRKETADAEGALAEEQNKQRLEKMDPLERIKELKRQQKALNDEAANAPDAKTRAEKKTEALKLNDEIDKAQKELEGNKGDKKPSVISSSLASIGGGGRAYIGGDPALAESRRQTSLLQQLVRNTSGGSGLPGQPAANPF